MATKYYYPEHKKKEVSNRRYDRWYEEATKALRNSRGVEVIESTAIMSTFRMLETNSQVRVYNMHKQPTIAEAPIQMEVDPRLIGPSETALRTIIGEIREVTTGASHGRY